MTERPLAGRTVVITRRPEQSDEIRAALASLGARVIELPAIEVRAVADPSALDQALRALSSFDWIAFTSANAVRAVKERLTALDATADFEQPPPRLAVVGRATAQALETTFPRATVALDPGGDARAAGLGEAFRTRGVAGQRVLLPSSRRGRRELAEGLARAGAEGVVVEAYDTVEPAGLGAAIEQCLEAGPDLFVFASPSAVDNLAGAAEGRLAGRAAVVIGPTTEEAARAAGLDVRAVAGEPSARGLVAAVRGALGA